MEYIVETNELTKTYRAHGKVITALDHETLNIRSKSVFGLLGPNGAGKTTFIMILMGLTLPTSGTAKVLGYDVVKESLKIRRKVGFMPDGIGFYDHLTAQQNLDYVAALNDIPQGERRRLIDDALETTGLSEFEKRKVGEFSKGMKQRLAIAQTLLKDGDFLIFDEPTAGIDPEGTREFKNIINQLNKEKGKTALISTHLLSEIGPICSDIAIIRQGRIVVQGGVSEIIERTVKEEGYWIEVEFNKDASSFASSLGKLKGVKSMEVKDRRIVLNTESDIRPAIAKAVRKKTDLLSLRRLDPSLEDLFMKFYEREEEMKEIG